MPAARAVSYRPPPGASWSPPQPGIRCFSNSSPGISRRTPVARRHSPPALHGLLASRLDLLPEDERTLLERGAVEGDLFHLESVAAGPGPGRSAAISGPSLGRALDALIRRDLVAPVAA